MNEKRAQWAEMAVNAFMLETMPNAGEELARGNRDLLADIGHLIERDGGDAVAVFTQALQTYLSEIEVDDEPSVSLSGVGAWVSAWVWTGKLEDDE